MFLSVGASIEAKPFHVCSAGPVSTRHAVVCVFLAFIKITISPLTLAYLLNRNCTLLYSTPTPLYRYCISLAISGGERHSFVLSTHTHYDTSDCCPVFPPSAVTLLHRCTVVVHAARRPVIGPPVSKAVQ